MSLILFYFLYIYIRNGERAMQNLSQLSQLNDKVHIPKIYPEYSSKRILVCEWVDGVKLTDTNKIESLGLDYKEAMKIAIEAFASQIFISGFVHGNYINIYLIKEKKN